MVGTRLAVSISVIQGSDKGKSFSFSNKRATIGRDLANNLSVVDDEVSRWHCSILVEGDGLFVEDLDSSNGTFLNNQRIQRSRLNHGDELRIGQTVLLLGTENDGSELQDDPPSCAHETNYVDQESLDTCVMTLTGPATINSDSNEDLQDVGRRFVKIQNDLRFVYETSLATSRKVDTVKMLEDLLGLIFGWIAPDRGCVFLYDSSSESYPICLVKNHSVASDTNLQVCNGIVDYVIEQKVGVLSRDPQDEVRQSSFEVLHSPISEIMCVPIQARGRLLGLFYVDTLFDSSSKQVSRFTKDHLRLMLSMAHQAAVVIENENNFRTLLEKEKLAGVGETTALLSHQINNILQGISGGRHLLELGLEQNNIRLAKEGWDVVERNQARVSQMMLDLVFLSKPYEPKTQTCNLVELVTDAIASVSKLEELSNFDFQFESQRQNIDCELDRAAFSSSIENVLQLAAKACKNFAFDKKDRVEVSVTSEDESLGVVLEYFGAEIFTTSDQLDDRIHDTTRLFGGIEMAHCEKLVRGHGGNVAIESLETGANRVSLTFPAKL